MPDSSSMIRTVPGGKVGRAGGGGWVDGVGDCAMNPSSVPGRPMRTAAPTTATRTSSAIPMTQPGPGPPPADDSSGGRGPGRGSGSGAGGARTGEDRTATPGPAGVATSDQAAPFHQRTSPGVPSGSAYQPGGGAGGPGAVTGSTLGGRLFPVRSRPGPREAP